CSGWRPNSLAAARALSLAVCMPLRPVQALALPEFTSTARQRPWLSARFCRERSTGAASTRLVVNRPAAVVAGASQRIKAKSSSPCAFLIPAAIAAPRKPRAEARLPSTISHFCMLALRRQQAVAGSDEDNEHIT